MSDEANLPSDEERWTSEKLYKLADALKRYLDDPGPLGDLPFLPKGIRKGFVEVDRDARIAYIKRARSSADTLAKFEAEGKDNAQVEASHAPIREEFSWEEAEPIYGEMVKKEQITWVEFLRLSAVFTKLRGSEPDNS
jgi:hypothetical protein